MKLTKAQATALGKVFAREIGGGPVPLLQSKAKVFADLQAVQMVEEVTIELRGWPPVRVTGWGLTERGRFYYCEWASQQEADV